MNLKGRQIRDEKNPRATKSLQSAQGQLDEDIQSSRGLS